MFALSNLTIINMSVINCSHHAKLLDLNNNVICQFVLAVFGTQALSNDSSHKNWWSALLSKIHWHSGIHFMQF